MKVWDGTSTSRPDPLTRGVPDGADWLVITKELQATQKFVANLAANVDVMPNLVSDIQARQKQLGLLQAEISKLTVPEDVMVQVTKLNTDMEKLSSIYEHAGEVLQTVSFLQRQLLNLGSRIDEHIKETNRCRKSFENQVANWQRVNEKRWGDRLDEAEKQLGAIALALGLKKFGE